MVRSPLTRLPLLLCFNNLLRASASPILQSFLLDKEHKHPDNGGGGEAAEDAELVIKLVISAVLVLLGGVFAGCVFSF